MIFHADYNIKRQIKNEHEMSQLNNDNIILSVK